jgi:16S rRNA G966 N2-methylase RsmD
VTNFHKCFKELNENNKESKFLIENLKKENIELKNNLLERDANVSFLQDQTEKCINDFVHLQHSYEAEIQNSKSLSEKNNELEFKNIDLLNKLREQNCELEELKQMKTKFKEIMQFFSEKEKPTTETTNNRALSNEIEQQSSITTALENPMAKNPLNNELKKEPLQIELAYSPISLDTVAVNVVDNSSEITPAPSNTIEIKTEKIVPSLLTSLEDVIDVDDDDDEIIFINSANVYREKCKFEN